MPVAVAAWSVDGLRVAAPSAAKVLVTLAASALTVVVEFGTVDSKVVSAADGALAAGTGVAMVCEACAVALEAAAPAIDRTSCTSVLKLRCTALPMLCETLKLRGRRAYMLPAD